MTLTCQYVLYLVKSEFNMANSNPKSSFPLCFVGAYQPHEVNHVIVQERRRDDAGDVAMGMLAGAATGLALGSLFSVF